MLVTGIYAMSAEIISTKNKISTSSVAIELKEYNQNGDPFDEDGKMVMPGDKINLTTKVNNIGIDCYIRAKLIYKYNNDIIAENNYINGNYKSWEEKNGYYYYKSVFKQNETVELFNELVIPEYLSNSNYGKNVTLTIIVDAIQSKNFDNNWNNINIKKRIDRTYNISPDGEMSIIYENDTLDHIKIDDNFFDNIEKIVPGDKISEDIIINNTSKKKNKYFLSIEYNNLDEEELKLLNKVEAIIKKENGEIIVKDSLAKIKDRALGIYKSGEKTKLTISLYFPKDSDNDYSKLSLEIIFKFYLEDVNDNIINPKTNDINLNLYLLAFIISSIGFILVLFIEKKASLE